jgi:hypothetical protein
VRLTARDLQLLSFLAEHRLVLETHVRCLLDASPDAARTRLRSLARGGLISYRRVFDGGPACCQIRRPGLEAIESRLPAPRLSLGGYRHDVGLAWLWLAAHAGSFGPIGEVIAERTLRSRDGARGAGEPPCGIRLGGVGPHGQERIHYPDLLLVTPRGQRIAVELELTGKGRARRETILAGYATDRRIDAVLYLVEKRPLRQAIEASAGRMGVSDLVHVRYVQWGDGKPPAAGGLARGRERTAVVEVAR